jgi:ribonuclease HII
VSTSVSPTRRKAHKRRVRRLPLPRGSDGLPLRLAGIDEAGRGPLAGPVVAAAVILDPRQVIRGMADSKLLTPEQRAALAPRIRARSLAWAVAWADAEEIDSLNIFQATLLAMRRALLALPVCPTHVQVDGNRVPQLQDLALDCSVEAVVGGDRCVAAISAASILAKTHRDAMMARFDACYPGFGFASHKGYATAAHRAALREHDPSPLHRRSFAHVQDPQLLLALEEEDPDALAPVIYDEDFC